MLASVFTAIDIGDRDEQQDRYLVLSDPKDEQNQLLVVADGAGGHAAGGLAAQTAIDYIAARATDIFSSEELESYLDDLSRACNEAVLAIGAEEKACSTLVIVVIKGDQLYWAHVGDSRYYQVRDGRVIFKTQDHSLVELSKTDTSFREEAAVSSNQLYMCLGAQPSIQPQVNSGIAKEGDILLLCSDGLWGQLDVERLYGAMPQTHLSQQHVDEWVLQAKSSKSGSSDNITVVSAQFVRPKRGLFCLWSWIFGSKN